MRLRLLKRSAQKPVVELAPMSEATSGNYGPIPLLNEENIIIYEGNCQLTKKMSNVMIFTY